MLDDKQLISQVDKSNALGVAAQLAEQLGYSDFTFSAPDLAEIENVVLAGMGGSALGGQICKTWWAERLKVPFEIVRDYSLPAYVGKNTVVITSSYSGNTEETLAAFQEAKTKGANIIAVAAGGKLQELAEQDNRPFVQLPTDYQPRMTTGFNLKVLATIFEQLGLVSGAVAELEASKPLLKQAVSEYIADKKIIQNPAKELALKLKDTTIWIYAGSSLAPAAYKWKINFNENAKNVAAWNVLPELNHNESIGWTARPKDKPFSLIELQSRFDNQRIQKRFAVTNKLLSENMPQPVIIKAQGRNLIEQILWAILLGDFVSIYLAVLNGVDPTPVEMVEKLKKELN